MAEIETIEVDAILLDECFTGENMSFNISLITTLLFFDNISLIGIIFLSF
jgi:hypothetical protein